jgi:hypothetical protein
VVCLYQRKAFVFCAAPADRGGMEFMPDYALNREMTSLHQNMAILGMYHELSVML